MPVFIGPSAHLGEVEAAPSKMQFTEVVRSFVVVRLHFWGKSNTAERVLFFVRRADDASKMQRAQIHWM
jgi:hypothetical protein